MSELTSQLLVAMPQLDDPNFKRSVVLLVHHGAGGSFGIVLNRSLDLTIGELIESTEENHERVRVSRPMKCTCVVIVNHLI